MKEVADDPEMPSWMRSPRNKKSTNKKSEEKSPLISKNGILKEHFVGPLCQRKFTDLLFLLIFVAFWIGMFYLGYKSFSGKAVQSSWKYITEGVDYHGKTCGDIESMNGAGRNKSVLYFPDLQNNPLFGVCINHCPEFYGEDIYLNISTVKKEIKVHWKTYATFLRTYYCAPADNGFPSNTQLSDNLGRLVGALGESPLVLLAGIGIAIACSLLYVLLLALFGRILLAISSIAVQAALLFGGYLLWNQSKHHYYLNDPAMKRSLQIAAILLFGGSIAFFFLVIFMAKRFFISGTFINYSNKALLQMKNILLIPIVNFIFLGILFTWGIVVTICIFSAGISSLEIAHIHATSPSTFDVAMETFKFDINLRWMFFYHLFGMYWTFGFFLGVGEMIVAISISIWFFSKDKDSEEGSFKKELNVNPVLLATKATLKYHLGTIAFGSAFISIIHSFRWFLLYLQDKHKNDSNKVIEVVYRCCCCCIWCFDKSLKYVCKEAYYVTAIDGTNFCTSAHTAHRVITSNLLKVGALDIIGNASVLLGKFIVCTTSCLICWFMLSSVSSPVIPLLAVLLISYAIAHACLTIYETSINAMLMCFIFDEDMNGGQGQACSIDKRFTKSVDANLRPSWQTSF